MRDGFLMIKEVSLCVCVCVLVGGLMERVRDSRNDKSMEVLKQEIMKWREREGGGRCVPPRGDRAKENLSFTFN